MSYIIIVLYYLILYCSGSRHYAVSDHGLLCNILLCHVSRRHFVLYCMTFQDALMFFHVWKHKTNTLALTSPLLQMINNDSKPPLKVTEQRQSTLLGQKSQLLSCAAKRKNKNNFREEKWGTEEDNQSHIQMLWLPSYALMWFHAVALISTLISWDPVCDLVIVIPLCSENWTKILSNRPLKTFPYDWMRNVTDTCCWRNKSLFLQHKVITAAIMPSPFHLLVEVLVDFPLVWESQHAADHTRVFNRPALVANLCPAVFVFHLHDTLCDGRLLSGHRNHGPEPHLLDPVIIDPSLHRDNQTV